MCFCASLCESEGERCTYTLQLPVMTEKMQKRAETNHRSRETWGRVNAMHQTLGTRALPAHAPAAEHTRVIHKGTISEEVRIQPIHQHRTPTTTPTPTPCAFVVCACHDLLVSLCTSCENPAPAPRMQRKYFRVLDKLAHSRELEAGGGLGRRL